MHFFNRNAERGTLGLQLFPTRHNDSAFSMMLARAYYYNGVGCLVEGAKTGRKGAFALGLT